MKSAARAGPSSELLSADTELPDAGTYEQGIHAAQWRVAHFTVAPEPSGHRFVSGRPFTSGGMKVEAKALGCAVV